MSDLGNNLLDELGEFSVGGVDDLSGFALTDIENVQLAEDLNGFKSMFPEDWSLDPTDERIKIKK